MEGPVWRARCIRGQAAEQAIEIAPSFALGHLVLGMSRLFSGDARNAVGPLEQGLLWSPHDPQNFVWYALLGLSHLFAGAPELAREKSLRALKIRPGWRTTLEVLVVCCVAMGDWDSAGELRRDYHATPPPSGDVLAPLRARNPAWAAQLAAGVSSNRT